MVVSSIYLDVAMLHVVKCLAVVASVIVAPVVRAQLPDTSGRAAPDSSEVLRPGDSIRLRIWREPDLSGDFPVNESGIAVLPKVGPLKVTDQSPAALKAKLVSTYQVFLSHASIDVTLMHRVQVMGAVRTPGVYTLDPTMTIGDALAVAGGTTPEGDKDKLYLIRHGQTVPDKISYRAMVGDSPIRSGDQIYVPERSWFSRNTGIVASVITAGVSLAIALFTR